MAKVVVCVDVPIASESEHLGWVRGIYVLVQGVRVELRQDERAFHAGVDDVGQGKIDEPVRRGKLERCSAFVLRQRVTRRRPARHNDGL